MRYSQLETLLDINYYGFTQHSGQRCIDLVVRYIQENNTVSDEDIIFIKNLTKVAGRIVEDTSRLDGQLEKLYRFNMEGVDVVRKDSNGLTENRSINIESHLFSHAGDAAEALFTMTGDVEWAERWY